MRGDIGGSAKKVGLRIKELERIYGIREGSAGNSELNNSTGDTPKTESELAEQLGVSRYTLQNYKQLADMILELSELVDTGIVTKTTALSIMRIKEISENEVRKDFSKAERIDYARRLERIESLKAEKRKAATQFGNDTVRLNSDTPQRTDESVASKLGIGSGEQYRKEKFISDNRSTLTPEDFANLDEGRLRLSTNKHNFDISTFR